MDMIWIEYVKIMQIFSQLCLRTTINTNLKEVDQTLTGILTQEISNYYKPNDEASCIDINSNHPAAVIKQINNISRRIFNLSADKDTFEIATPYYNAVLERPNFMNYIYYI